MVDAITPVSASAATPATQVDRSLSITSEPDNKWVAARQSKIESDQVTHKQENIELQAEISRFAGQADEEMEVSPDGQREHHRETETSDHDAEEPKLSGESDSIGTVDFDDDTPFGHRTAFI